jgi:hypothetical protein
MTNHRAHLANKDVSVFVTGEKKGRQKGLSGVQLVTKADQWPWDVTFIAPLQSRNLLLGASNNKRAGWLLKQIQKCGFKK